MNQHMLLFLSISILKYKSDGSHKYRNNTIHMQLEEAESVGGEDRDFKEIDHILEDFGNPQEQEQMNKSDAVLFAVDCQGNLFDKAPGQLSQFQKVIKAYGSFLKSKIISNPNDRVSLLLYNVCFNVYLPSQKHTNNSLKFNNIHVVHSFDTVSAARIKETERINNEWFETKMGGVAPKQTPLYEVLWLYNQEVKDIDKKNTFLRLFLFTCNDNPHPIGNTERDQAINHARKLANEQIQIQLFPLRTFTGALFDIRKFFVNILTLDLQQINDAILDSSSRIMDLQQRMRQKQFKKRTLNRILFNIDPSTQIGVKLFCLYNQPKKPVSKKLHARTNKPLKRVVRELNADGEVLHEIQVGTAYPLCDQKIILSKQDALKLKTLSPPGMTLVGFKPRKKLKVYHNYRTSYFVYPDEDHVTGSAAFFDALIDKMHSKGVFAVAKLTPRVGCQLRFVALLPQKESYDLDHFQTPPGLNLIYLPYSEDLAEYVGDKTKSKPVQISEELVHMTKLLINNMTLTDFDLTNFEDPSIQKFYAHLQAHALGEQEVQEPEDLIRPDEEAMEKCRDMIQLIKDTVKLEISENIGKPVGGDEFQIKDEYNDRSEDRYEQKAQKRSKPQPGKASKKGTKSKKKGGSEYDSSQNLIKEEELEGDSEIMNMDRAFKEGEFDFTAAQLKKYLKAKGLQATGKKEELIDRILVYLAS